MHTAWHIFAVIGLLEFFSPLLADRRLSVSRTIYVHAAVVCNVQQQYNNNSYNNNMVDERHRI